MFVYQPKNASKLFALGFVSFYQLNRKVIFVLSLENFVQNRCRINSHWSCNKFFTKIRCDTSEWQHLVRRFTALFKKYLSERLQAAILSKKLVHLQLRNSDAKSVNLNFTYIKFLWGIFHTEKSRFWKRYCFNIIPLVCISIYCPKFLERKTVWLIIKAFILSRGYFKRLSGRFR